MYTFFRRLTHVCCEKAVSKLFPEKCHRYARLFERQGCGNFFWTGASKVKSVEFTHGQQHYWKLIAPLIYFISHLAVIEIPPTAKSPPPMLT